MDIYFRAWNRLLEQIESRPRWKKDELKWAALRCLLDAVVAASKELGQKGGE